MLHQGDVGGLFTTNGTDAWRLRYFIEGDAIRGDPDLVSMYDLESGEIIKDSPQALDIRQFKRLVMEEE
jgi:hypothetical protein